MAHGCIIIMDLDRFKELSRAKGWSEYTPNVITGTLTLLVEDFIRKHFAVVIYGLDEIRGTEEVILEIPNYKMEDLNVILEDLEDIRRKIRELGGSISIAITFGPISGQPAKSRREAYSNPLRRRALRLLRKAKRSGGNRIVVG